MRLCVESQSEFGYNKKVPKHASTVILLILLCLTTAFSVYLQIFYPQRWDEKQRITLQRLPELPVSRLQANSGLAKQQWPNLSAQSAYAVDLSSMTVLYEKNAEEMFYPASTSKMMTALVARDVFDLDQTLTVSSDAAALAQGTEWTMKTQDKITVSTLLPALLVSSHNAAAYVLAENDPAGETDFIERMNQKAQSWSLMQTHFVNPAGFDEEGQQSSARDLALLAKELLKDEYLRQLVAQPQLLMTLPTGKPILLQNTNELFASLQGVQGVKTGTTELAKEVLVSLVEKNGHHILIALMASEDRYTDTKNLLAWIFNSYQWQTFDASVNSKSQVSF